MEHEIDEYIQLLNLIDEISNSDKDVAFRLVVAAFAGVCEAKGINPVDLMASYKYLFVGEKH